MNPFGGPVVLADEVSSGISKTSPHRDMDLVHHALAALDVNAPGILRCYRPQPTAAFAPRDMIADYHARAAKAVADAGFAPVERLAGGHLAVYDGNAVVIDLVSPHAKPREHIQERFRLFAGAIASALKKLSIDARIGALPGEYCPGAYSVNGGGLVKLVGNAQRINKNGYHLGAVLSVTPSHQAKAAIAAAYAIMGIKFDPATFGAMTELKPGLSFDALCKAIQHSITALVEVKLP